MTSQISELSSFPMERAHGCPFDPPPELRRRQQEEPVSRIRLWDDSTAWLVTGYEDQRALLGDSRISADPRHDGYPHQTPGSRARRAVSRTFISMDNPEHDVLRRMLTGNFVVKRVEALRPRIQQIVDELIDEMLAGPKPADLVRAFALPVPSLVICELLGVPYSDHAFFQRLSRALISRDSTPEAAVEATRELHEYFMKLVRDKRNDPGDGVLDRLVAGQVADGALTMRQAADMAILLLVAGHETTANMIALGTLALLRNPAQLAEIRQTGDKALIANAVEELLRYLNITHSGRRRVALEDIEIGGTTIKAGDGVVLANDIGNRDERAFPGNPDELDIHRKARHHVAFGYGIHQCLGQPLARAELQVVYGTLYRRVPTLRPAVPFEEIRFKHDMLVYGVHELPVTW
ncbi:cytochrome P450 [Amycolatopsis samaneae]